MHNMIIFYSDMYTTFRGATLADFCEKTVLSNPERIEMTDKNCPHRVGST